MFVNLLPWNTAAAPRPVKTDEIHCAFVLVVFNLRILKRFFPEFLDHSDSCMSSAVIDSQLLKTIAAQIGFEECRIVDAAKAQGFDRLIRWLEKGYGGSMQYIQDRLPAYQHPKGVMPGVQSILMLITSYRFPESEPPESNSRGQVARYASSDVDYHDVLHARTKNFIAQLRAIDSKAAFRGVVDSAPLLEREFAQQAGLGWIGKNTMLISRQWGSYFFLSAILTDVPLEPDPPFTADHCGSCRACLDACPTNAFVEPRVMDATRCISYLTIENRAAPALELRESIGDWVFGCDVCQEVCPWNRKAAYASDPKFKPNIDSRWLDLNRLLGMDEEQFRSAFRKTPFWRAKLVGLQRNALIASTNQRTSDSLRWAVKFLDHPATQLRIVAAWAIGEIGSETELQMLRDRQLSEVETEVRGEIELAINQIAIRSQGRK